MPGGLFFIHPQGLWRGRELNPALECARRSLSKSRSRRVVEVPASLLHQQGNRSKIMSKMCEPSLYQGKQVSRSPQ